MPYKGETSIRFPNTGPYKTSNKHPSSILYSCPEAVQARSLLIAKHRSLFHVIRCDEVQSSESEVNHIPSFSVLHREAQQLRKNGTNFIRKSRDPDFTANRFQSRFPVLLTTKDCEISHIRNQSIQHPLSPFQFSIQFNLVSLSVHLSVSPMEEMKKKTWFEKFRIPQNNFNSGTQQIWRRNNK